MEPGGVVALVVFLVLVVLACWKLYRVAAASPRGAAVKEITNGSVVLEENQKELAKLIALNFEEYRTNTRWWSLVYYACVFLSALLSASAGIMLQLEYFVANDGLKKDLAALLAMSAAVLGAITTNGDFQRKWTSNRIAASGMENVAYDLLKKPFTDEDKRKLIARIQEINLKRNQEIVADNGPRPEPRDASEGGRMRLEKT
jgi:hypothetical protein